MKVGLTYNLKADMAEQLRESGLPVTDDQLEEYDSQETLDALAGAIQKKGVEVVRLGWGKKLITNLLSNGGVDLVFNVAEGWGGRCREAQVPALLDMLGVKYVGSDPLACAVSLDKQATKDIVRANGVLVPKGYLLRDPNMALKLKAQSKLDYPLIVKPAYEGSSKGIRNNSVVRTDIELLDRATELVTTYAQPVLVEEFVQGREVTVGVVGDPPRIFGIMELTPKKGSEPWIVYTVEAKRDFQTMVEFHVPPDFSEETIRNIQSAALAAFNALGCRDFARVDFRVRGSNGQPVFLEINPLPGLNPVSSDLPIMSRFLKVPYDDLIGEIFVGAARRFKLC